MEAILHGNAVPAIPVHESLRKISTGKNQCVDRREYQLIQTPQCFRAALLKEAYRHARHSDFTDDASVVEDFGTAIHLVQGLKENIKITTQPDLHMAEGLIRHFDI